MNDDRMEVDDEYDLMMEPEKYLLLLFGISDESFTSYLIYALVSVHELIMDRR